MPIPAKLAVTFCRECQNSIQTGGLCTFGCQWDATTNTKERPILVRTYFLPETEPYQAGQAVCPSCGKSPAVDPTVSLRRVNRKGIPGVFICHPCLSTSKMDDADYDQYMRSRL